MFYTHIEHSLLILKNKKSMEIFNQLRKLALAKAIITENRVLWDREAKERERVWENQDWRSSIILALINKNDIQEVYITKLTKEMKITNSKLIPKYADQLSTTNHHIACVNT
mgnify:CR=1 FL=1